MPIYEYSCKKCGKVFELQQSIKDPPLSHHEGCGGEVKRLISPSGFILKGTGWYATDYKKSSQKEANGEGKKEEKKEEKKGESTPPCGESCTCAS
jgi:putative FmdB family regulatory protein